MSWFKVRVYAVYAIIVLGLSVAPAAFDWAGDNAPHVAPLCIKSHLETVPAHLVIYVYDLHTAFVGPQVASHWTPEAQESRCDQWIGGF